MLKQRIITALLLVPLVLGALFFLPLKFFALLAALFYRLDRRHKFTGGHSKNYAVVARKPL